MESTKTQFQKDLVELEASFMSFKESHPQTFGVLWRQALPYVLMVLSIFMAVDAFSTLTSFTPCITSFAVLIFAILLWNRTAWLYDAKGVKFNTLNMQINAVENKYAEYPDVAVLVKQLRKSASAARKHKLLIKSLFWLSFLGFFAIYGVKIYLGFAEQSDKVLSNKVQMDYYCDALNLQSDVPMLQISPLKTDIADGVTLKTEHIDVYLHYYRGGVIVVDRDTSNVYRTLRMIAPSISGGDSTDQYRLMITDETGRPVNGCPPVFFSAEDQGKIIMSDDFPFYDYSKHYQFQALHTLKYLQDHQQQLRFLVEKVN